MTRDDDPIVTRRSPDEAFGLLGNETRFRILRVLNDADGSLQFSELRSRVGADDPGGFNYHLGKLTGQFVRETDDGYAIASPGERIVGAVLSGWLTAEFGAGSVPVDGACIHCGGRLEAVFRDHGITIDCTDCEWAFTDPEIPAGVMEGFDATDAPTVVARWLRMTATRRTSVSARTAMAS
ncbi:helix-turn-helix domain-containing protein [Haladaptatus sp. R4]|uniref:winged helix-turn-helix domain-containing protein n=1 Tax=Haladaptatus sp. R4 TaxID=1679489 RepID=UPI000A540504|nr:helix-turn-helix domain-containing protein [Haladaptatus sp. R4]